MPLYAILKEVIYSFKQIVFKTFQQLSIHT